jgi:hypothetical protein
LNCVLCQDSRCHKRVSWTASFHEDIQSRYKCFRVVFPRRALHRMPRHLSSCRRTLMTSVCNTLSGSGRRSFAIAVHVCRLKSPEKTSSLFRFVASRSSFRSR